MSLSRYGNHPVYTTTKQIDKIRHKAFYRGLLAGLATAGVALLLVLKAVYHGGQ
jgi:hypothetical protein